MWDVTAVAHVDPGASDAQVGERARREDRIILTADDDFGTRAFRDGESFPGVIFIDQGMVAERPLHEIADAVIRLADVRGAYVIVEIDRVRRRPLP